jgi:hypothetical protein
MAEQPMLGLLSQFWSLNGFQALKIIGRLDGALTGEQKERARSMSDCDRNILMGRILELWKATKPMYLCNEP